MLFHKFANVSITDKYMISTLGGSGIDYFISVILDSSDNIIVAGYTDSQGAGSNDGLLVKLPPDGIEDGVYDVFTAATSTLTAATSTLTASNSTLIETFTTLTETFTTL